MNIKNVCAIVVLLVASSSATAGLIDKLFVTDGDRARLAIIEGTAATIKTTYQRGFPLAVRDSIWLGDYSAPNPAVEYDLNGNATGNTMNTYTPVFGVDGAVNGATNYTLGNAFTTSATVYSAASDWSGMTALFTVSGFDLVGITFDSVFDTLWISDQNSIYQYDLAGTLLSQFSHVGGRGSLAYEAASDTLWYVTNFSDTIRQYSKTGALLDTLQISGLTSNNWGAEFAAGSGSVPLPTPLALLGLGLAGIGFCRRTKA